MTLPAIVNGVKRPAVDTVSVIDLEAQPPRVVDRVVVGDAPEGLAISPKGDVAVAVLLGGASVPKTMWFNTKRNGSLAVLKVDGKNVTKVGEVEVGGRASRPRSGDGPRRNIFFR